MHVKHSADGLVISRGCAECYGAPRVHFLFLAFAGKRPQLAGLARRGPGDNVQTLTFHG